jgi:hypothetical protein
VKRNIDRKIAVGIICTKNFLDRNLALFVRFHTNSLLYKIKPLIKKNSGILKSSKKLE